MDDAVEPVVPTDDPDVMTVTGQVVSKRYDPRSKHDVWSIAIPHADPTWIGGEVLKAVKKDIMDSSFTRVDYYLRIDPDMVNGESKWIDKHARSITQSELEAMELSNDWEITVIC